MALTISERIVRNWERMRRRREARRGGVTPEVLAVQEREQRCARELASHLSRPLSTRIAAMVKRRLAELRIDGDNDLPEAGAVPSLEEKQPADQSPPQNQPAGPPEDLIAADSSFPPLASDRARPGGDCTAASELTPRLAAIEARIERLTAEVQALGRTIESVRQRVAQLTAAPSSQPCAAPPPAKAAPPPAAAEAPAERRIPLGDIAGMLDQVIKHYR